MGQVKTFPERFYSNSRRNPDLSTSEIEQFLKSVDFDIEESYFETSGYPYMSYNSIGLSCSNCTPSKVLIDGDLTLTFQPQSVDGRSADYLSIKVADPTRIPIAFQYLHDLLAPEGIKFQLVVKSENNPIPE